MKYRIIYFALTSLLFSCSGTEKESYFDFDQVVHYSFKNARTHFDCNTGVILEDFGCEIVNHVRPMKISDSLFIDSLHLLGYSKTEIDTSKYIKLKQVFSETKPPLFDSYSACEPIYRDILIFKKSNQITGMAKICFECSQKVIIGNKVKVNGNFDYSTLNEILYE